MPNGVSIPKVDGGGPTVGADATPTDMACDSGAEHFQCQHLRSAEPASSEIDGWGGGGTGEEQEGIDSHIEIRFAQDVLSNHIIYIISQIHKYYSQNHY